MCSCRIYPATSRKGLRGLSTLNSTLPQSMLINTRSRLCYSLFRQNPSSHIAGYLVFFTLPFEFHTGVATPSLPLPPKIYLSHPPTFPYTQNLHTIPSASSGNPVRAQPLSHQTTNHSPVQPQHPSDRKNST